MATSCSALLEEALQLGTQELDALRTGDVEQAETLYEQRAAVTEQAYALLDTHDASIRDKVLLLQNMQQALVDEATVLSQSIHQNLVASRQQHRRMKGYGLSLKQAAI